MSWREWFGFTKPRDDPDTELPQIEDNVRNNRNAIRQRVSELDHIKYLQYFKFI